jgi:hypothetical protein
VETHLLPSEDVDELARREFGGFSYVQNRRPICHHGFETWTDCPACTAVADFDDGGPE